MKKLFKTYLPFSRASIQDTLQYPFEVLMYFAGMTIGVFVVYFIWNIIYESGNYAVLEGFSLKEMIAYIVLSFITMQATDNGAVWIIADEVRTGGIVMNLIKPINYHLRVFFMVLGNSGFVMTFIGLPCIVLLAFILKVGTLVNLMLFLVSLILGLIISFLFDFIFGMMAFYVKNLWGIGFGKYALVRLLSGALIPLAFFPKSLQSLLELLPFKGIVYTPIMIFLGKYQGIQVLENLLHQVLWIIVLGGMNYLVWRKAITRLTIQGG